MCMCKLGYRGQARHFTERQGWKIIFVSWIVPGPFPSHPPLKEKPKNPSHPLTQFTLPLWCSYELCPHQYQELEVPPCIFLYLKVIKTILGSTMRKKMYGEGKTECLFLNVEDGKWKSEIYLSKKSANPVFCQQVAALSVSWLFPVGRRYSLLPPTNACGHLQSPAAHPEKEFPRGVRLNRRECHVAKKMKWNFKTSVTLLKGT